MSEWKPIETAPKDGTKILLGRFVKKCPHKKNGYQSVDWYRTDQMRHGYTGFGDFNERMWPATHWQPLPSAPSPMKESKR